MSIGRLHERSTGVSHRTPQRSTETAWNFYLNGPRGPLTLRVKPTAMAAKTKDCRDHGDEAAWHEFARSGYAATTIETVARRAGVSTKTGTAASCASFVKVAARETSFGFTRNATKLAAGIS
jgi:hypothetical protein